MRGGVARDLLHFEDVAFARSKVFEVQKKLQDTHTAYGRFPGRVNTAGLVTPFVYNDWTTLRIVCEPGA